ncbi:MAG: hypothetical protein IJ851_07120 [Eubacterium sp.]|nr:hypothetical protein [Eubacterium sp.]
MPKTKPGIPLLAICLTVAAGCVFQFAGLLMRSADSSASEIFAYLTYFFIALNLISSYVYAIKCRKLVRAVVTDSKSNNLIFATALICAGLLYDFVHQCYNCYSYFENAGYIDYSYIVPVALSGVFALISCAYYIAFYLCVKGTGVDYRNFTAFHFAPLLWAFFKTANLVTQLFDIKSGAQEICHFILLVSLLPFFLCFAAASDKKERGASNSFIMSALFCASMCFIVSAPRLAMFVLGGGNNLEKVTFSSPTYFLLGLFIVAVLRENRKAEKSVIIGE